MATKLLLIAAVVTAFLNPVKSASAQEKLRLAWAGFSPTNSPIWVIEERKLLQKQGVTPEIIAINASPTVLQALLANEIDAASISVTTLTSSRLAGADTVMIVGVVPTFVDHIVSLSSITSVEQLKGKTGGVNRLGSTSDLGLRLALRKLGIDSDKDVKIIPTGGNPERFAALSKGITQFTIMPEPFLTQAEKLGFRNLYNVTDLKIPFWWNGVLSREAIVKSKRPLLLKLTRAMIEAIHIIKTEKEYAKALFKKNLGVADPEGLERAYKDYSNIFPETPYPNPDGVKTMLDDLAPKNPKAGAADPKTFVDMTLVGELDKAGFISNEEPVFDGGTQNMARSTPEEHAMLRPGLGRLKGKVAIVTGANSGIGRATARLFAREGAKVVCCDIQETSAPRIDALIQSEDGEAVFAKVDVTKQPDCERMIATAFEAFGDLDILYNNAGGGLRKKLHEHSDEEWAFVLDLNLNGMFRGARLALPHFMKKQSGAIVTTASSFGLLAAPEYPAYCATKAAIINLTRELALDYGPYGIRVNCVCPGAIETPRFRGFPPKPRSGDGMTESEREKLANSNKALLRMGQAEEVAYAVLFLVSDEASFITGHALVVDGGQTIAV